MNYDIHQLYVEKWRIEVQLSFHPTKILADSLHEVEQKIDQYDRLGFASILEQTKANIKLDSEHIVSKATEPRA